MSSRTKILSIVFFTLLNCHAEKIINIPSFEGDATERLQNFIDSASSFKGEPVTIKLSPAVYDISRKFASQNIYHVSNTTSFDENPLPVKHIGLWLKELENIVLDGNGATLLTHGELTTFVIDNCKNITLKNFKVTAADPSVTEIRILDKDSAGISFEVISPSEFVVDKGLFYFKGEDWIFGDGGKLTNLPQYAQVFYPDKNITLRCDYPLKDYNHVAKIEERTVRMNFDNVPQVNPGEIYQLRHGIRNEVCGFINLSKNILLENIDFNFMGNFGIVSQFSENLTYDSLRCSPSLESRRSNAGFADFVQMSGCKGKITIKNSFFEGSHDDPINIHGTYLKAVKSKDDKTLTVRYCHPQTYGFMPFFAEDEVEIANRHTLRPVAKAKVKDICQIDDYTFEIELDTPIPDILSNYNIDDLAVENISWTPDVEIINNYFARTPTRGILLTTRGKSLIENNTFFRIPMASILVSDDAGGWFESGPVKSLTIRNNTFIECCNPVIQISPEIDCFDGPVHENILIENNRFFGSKGNYFEIKATDNIIIRNNFFSRKYQ